MSTAATKKMIAAYMKMAAPTSFLSSFFRSPAQNFHNTEEVEIDIMRCEEDVSVAVTDISTGHRLNSEDLYTNKAFKPPVHKEAAALNAFSLLKREAGENPFQSSTFQAKASARALRVFAKMENKIRRAIELQASQVLQTGKVTLKDAAGVEVYGIDYKPKATHFPTAGTAWGTAGADPIGDLSALAEIIRTDGKSDPTDIIMGANAFEKFISNEDVLARFDNRRLNLGAIGPIVKRNGASFRGVVTLGNYNFNVWSYSGRYKDPATGNSTQFVLPGNVVMLDAEARLDATFGAIPSIVRPDARVLPFIPSRIRNTDGGMDIHTNAWVTADGEQLFVAASARPLMVPTDIDSFGCLITGA